MAEASSHTSPSALTAVKHPCTWRERLSRPGHPHLIAGACDQILIGELPQRPHEALRRDGHGRTRQTPPECAARSRSASARAGIAQGHASAAAAACAAALHPVVTQPQRTLGAPPASTHQRGRSAAVRAPDRLPRQDSHPARYQRPCDRSNTRHVDSRGRPVNSFDRITGAIACPPCTPITDPPRARPALSNSTTRLYRLVTPRARPSPARSSPNASATSVRWRTDPPQNIPYRYSVICGYAQLAR